MSINITLPPVDLSFKFSRLPDIRDDLRLNPGGIYALYDEDGDCLYVGKSKTMYNRLMSHRHSDFGESIDYVDIRFVESPADRDIYETYAISELNAIYNKDKVDAPAHQAYYRSVIDDLYDELTTVETLIEDAEEQISDIEVSLTPPSRRSYSNNFSDDETELSDSFYEYLALLDEFNGRSKVELEDELRYQVATLSELLEEKQNLKRRIDEYYAKLVV